MDPAVRGNVRSPTLAGLTVKNALWNRRIDTPGNLFDRRPPLDEAPCPRAAPSRRRRFR
jgi:hypothetical protein